MRTQMVVTGNLTSDPKTRRTKDGIQITEFGLAHNNRRLDRATGLWADSEPTFYSVTCWRRLADGVLTSLHKGDPVVVLGYFSTHEWERSDGHLRSELRIEAKAVGPDLSYTFAAVNRGSRNGQAASDAGPGKAVLSVVEDPEDEDEGVDPFDAGAELVEVTPGGGT